MTRLSLANLVANKETVIQFAKASGNPLFAKPVKELDAALDAYSTALEKLMMVVKLADDDELHKKILDAEKWESMTPSERQMHRIKKGVWFVGSREADGLV